MMLFFSQMMNVLCCAPVVQGAVLKTTGMIFGSETLEKEDLR